MLNLRTHPVARRNDRDCSLRSLHNHDDDGDKKLFLIIVGTLGVS